MKMEVPSPSKLRNYLYEYVLIAFALAIVALFMLYAKLNTKIIDAQTKQLQDNSAIMNRNTEALNQFLNWQRYGNVPTYPRYPNDSSLLKYIP